MSLVVYLDETGDHSLELIDKDFPIFAIEPMFLNKIIYFCKYTI